MDEKLKEILWSFSIAGGDEKKIKKVSLSKSEKVVVVWVVKPSDGELNDFRTASLPMEVESSVDILERLRRFDVDTRSLAEAASEIDSLRSGWVSVEDRLPEEGILVLTKSWDGLQFARRIDSSWVDTNDLRWLDTSVSYWISVPPIPSPCTSQTRLLPFLRSTDTHTSRTEPNP